MDYTEAFDYPDFQALTRAAVDMAESGAVAEPFASLLLTLRTCYAASAGPLYMAQNQGASYKALAFAADLSNMSKAQRVEWYRVAERIPLSARHIGHIIRELQARAGPRERGKGDGVARTGKCTWRKQGAAARPLCRGP